jgi:Leucine-rich repeat (LRR) protein
MTTQSNPTVGTAAVTTTSGPKKLADWGFTAATTRMDLSNRDITLFSSRVFAPFPNIETLILDSNQLKYLPVILFAQTPKLKTLSLAHNKLEEIDMAQFTGLEELESLNLSNNALTDLDPYTFDGLENLRVIDIRNNNIETLRFGLMQNLPSLENVYTSGNPVYSQLGVSRLQVILCFTNPLCIVS